MQNMLSTTTETTRIAKMKQKILTILNVGKDLKKLKYSQIVSERVNGHFSKLVARTYYSEHMYSAPSSV